MLDDVAADPDDRHVFVANLAAGTVSVINTATNTITHTIPVGTNPRSIAVAPDGERAYVSNLGSDSISVISTDSNTVIHTIPVIAPVSLAITQNGRQLFATTNVPKTVVAIDIPEDKVKAAITVKMVRLTLP